MLHCDVMFHIVHRSQAIRLFDDDLLLILPPWNFYPIPHYIPSVSVSGWLLLITSALLLGSF